MGIYIALTGVALLVRPAQVFGLLFNIDAITDAWIRVFGTLCVAFGTYYWGTAFGVGARDFDPKPRTLHPMPNTLYPIP